MVHRGGNGRCSFAELSGSQTSSSSDMLVVYSVSETSFTVQDRGQDQEHIAWDITVTCDFDAPEAVLTPGRSLRGLRTSTT
jgi:hypothetical protein